MTSIFDWSGTAASNATVGSINWAEGMAFNAVNDSARAEMADVAKWRDLLGGAKISSGTDTITLTSGMSLSAYAQGMMFAFEAGGTNTGAVTLNVDSIGAKAIVKNHDVALAAGDIEAGQIVLVAYKATADNFQMLSQSALAPLTSASIGVTVQAYDADTLKADTADVLTAGFAATPYNAGTKSSGTFTPDEANGNLQYAVNGGAHTLAPPTNNCTLVIQYTNDGSAGAITTSGFTVVTGDGFDTTNGNDFFAYITKCNGFSHLHVTALQ